SWRGWCRRCCCASRTCSSASPPPCAQSARGSSTRSDPTWSAALTLGDGAGRRGARAVGVLQERQLAQLGRRGLAVHVDEVEPAAALVQLVTEVVDRTDDEEATLGDLLPVLLQGSGDLLMDVALHVLQPLLLRRAPPRA